MKKEFTTFKDRFDLKKSKDYKTSRFTNGEPLTDGLKEKTQKHSVCKKYKY